MNIDQLPREVSLLVVCCLSPSDQYHVSLVSSHFFNQCNDQILWKKRYLKSFAHPLKEVTVWKEAYRKRVIGKLCDEIVKEADRTDAVTSLGQLKRILRTEDNYDCERAIFDQMFHGALEGVKPILLTNLKALNPSSFFRLLPHQTVFLFNQDDLCAVVLRLPVDPEDQSIIEFQYLVVEYPKDFSHRSDYVHRYVNMVSCFDASRTKVTIGAIFRQLVIRVPRPCIYFSIREMFDKTLGHF